ncbi:hypothetical protein BC332_13156 [Capsicum chinense]|nr:hypothetical protein BC332_13156 [Capsicum chinense]
MVVKGKLIFSMEVKCGGYSFHDIFHNKTHHIPKMSPSTFHHFEIHEGEIIKIGSIVGWKYIQDGKEMFLKEVVDAIDRDQSVFSRKVIEGNMLELYSSFTLVTSYEHHWTTLALVYEKKTEDTPEPITFLSLLINMAKDMEGHLLNQ